MLVLVDAFWIISVGSVDTAKLNMCSQQLKLQHQLASVLFQDSLGS